ncbi:MAG: TlpA family protein disulfide reductase [Gammaproteobacteria bacterium]|nr:TlpA family protein disulfide reductase [Gammaproteobacteria bacterium]MCW8923905.1 TlpA family protein disulfide reductase [Gammaproteobacteria bacterium]
MFTKQHFILLMLPFVFVSSASSAEVIEFSAKDLQGNVQSLEQYRGKWVVVNFWGTFCGPCIKEMPELSAFHNDRKDDDAVVIGINQEEIPVNLLANFTRNLKVSFPSLHVPFEQPTPFGKVTILPTTFIINPQGELVARQPGAISLETLENYIERKKQQALQEKFKQERGLDRS